jgi:hypothetical protein
MYVCIYLFKNSYKFLSSFIVTYSACLINIDEFLQSNQYYEKAGHAKGRSHERVKEVKKVNIVDVLPR